MTGVCPDCRGTGKRGRRLCRTCNPSGALGDVALGALARLWNRVAGKSTPAPASDHEVSIDTAASVLGGDGPALKHAASRPDHRPKGPIMELAGAQVALGPPVVALDPPVERDGRCPGTLGAERCASTTPCTADGIGQIHHEAASGTRWYTY